MVDQITLAADQLLVQLSHLRLVILPAAAGTAAKDRIGRRAKPFLAAPIFPEPHFGLAPRLGRVRSCVTIIGVIASFLQPMKQQSQNRQ
jgi:hypothetical protein